MSWPGTPKSQQSPALNPPSQRTPPVLSENSTMKDVAEAMGVAFDGLTVHEQAFANLPSAIETAATAAATAAVETIESETSSGVTAFNTLTGAVLYFPALGTVNDQLGNPLYLTQQSDNGAKIIVGDSTQVTVDLNQGVMAPWFTIIDNDSSAVAVLTTDSGASVFGEQAICPGGFGVVYYDGANFWCGATVIATDSSLGYVQPDNVTIGIDSGLISTIGATGTIPLGPLTDSGATGAIFVANGLITGWHSPT